MTTPTSNSGRSASARSRIRPSGSADPATSTGAAPSTLPVELLTFLDLLAELIATAVWQGTRGSTAPDESLTPRPDGHSAIPSSKAGNGGPIPSFPADSHPHSRSIPATPRRVTRRAPPKEAS